ncbi:MAG: pilM [Candidatus Kaiserbacteria bacterium]|nr:pilM [Candidatus Kaiserbacteria bacterium]
MSFHDITFVQTLDTFFPAPTFLVLRVAGVDISDTSVKWVILEHVNGKVRVSSYGEISINAGIVDHGIVKDVAGLGLVIQQLKKAIHPVTYMHVSLPEESVYVFSMSAAYGSTQDQIRTMIEFEFENRVPLSVGDAVYDFDIVKNEEGDQGMKIVVTAFPRELATNYARACEQGNMTALSFENELLSTSWAVADCAEEKTTLLIDFGSSRTGIACVRGRIPFFTATIPIGSGQMTEALVSSLGITDEQADTFKDTEGLQSPADSSGYKALLPIAEALGTQVERYFRLWGFEHDSTVSLIQEVILVGGGANVRGLPEYISQKIHVPVVRGNVWQRIGSFDEYIPPIEYDQSLQYATAIGLALRSISV